MDQSSKQQIAERLKNANNVLVTVSANPSVDQLAATIGFTLLLNKMGKHGTAVFSGEVPSTLEFLKPDETIEKTTDSLRDFIIALDKTKADKLRYKVEDKVVKIFITPYRTSLTEKDLEFSQGDFNVDAVVALGVKEQKDLDTAITAHGRILHDADVISINIEEKGNLGTINWNEPLYSSLCELLVSLGEELGPNLFDAQMATAFLTGIVAETQRFSNDQTSPHTMTVAARLMSLGANQQLIATKLETLAAPESRKAGRPRTKPTAGEPKPAAADEKTTDKDASNDGSLKIEHDTKEDAEATKKVAEKPAAESKPAPAPEKPVEEPVPETKTEDLTMDKLEMASKRVTEPPSRGSQLTANTEPEPYEPSIDPLSLPPSPSPLLSRFSPPTPPGPGSLPLPTEALSGTEEPTGLPLVSDMSTPVPDTDEARDAVNAALRAAPEQTIEPIQALNAQTVDLGKAEPPVTPDVVPVSAPVVTTPSMPPLTPFPEPTPPTTPMAPEPTPPAPTPPPPPLPVTPPSFSGPGAPPPVPPPMMPPAFGAPVTDDDNTPTQPLAPL